MDDNTWPVRIQAIRRAMGTDIRCVLPLVVLACALSSGHSVCREQSIGMWIQGKTQPSYVFAKRICRLEIEYRQPAGGSGPDSFVEKDVENNASKLHLDAMDDILAR